MVNIYIKKSKKEREREIQNVKEKPKEYRETNEDQKW